MVDVKTIVATAVLVPATSGVIVAHNHPSEDVDPSHGDIKLTENIFKVLDSMSVHLLDHIVLSQEGYYSMADQGRMNFELR
ncbi:MAG: hypothetical protein MRZ79_08635 [Bacteroidia bacterium]|nr:hypothetical protein [Bacteroidia bacterium]